MSRLIVKNLPKNVTENQIRQLFGETGTITDIQLKYTPDGKFRQFGFIGYQDENEALEAIKSLNSTFINTNKITVQQCATLGDSSKPKAWSKYAQDSSAYKKSHTQETEENENSSSKKTKGNKTAELLEKYKDDPLFEEFLEVHSSKEYKELIIKPKDVESNEEKNEEESSLDAGQESMDEQSDPSPDDKLADKKISDLEYMKELMKKSGKPRQRTEKKIKEKISLYTLKLKGLPYNCKKRDIKLFFKPLKPYSIRVPPKIHGIAYVGFKDEKMLSKGLLKDRSFLSGNRITVLKYTIGGNQEMQEDVVDHKQTKWKSQEESLKNEEDIAESGRLFIRNLAYTSTEDDLQKLFEKYGPLTEVNLPIDMTSRKTKGFGTITFLMPEHAVKAYSELDGSVLHGRMVHLLPAKSKDNPDEIVEGESGNYKLKKANKQKSQATKTHNWNALFLGHDAVAEVVADSFGTTKENVVGPHGQGSAAVRLALGETQIVAQTRKYLEQEGVVLDAFSTTGNVRSKTIILVKNLPSKTASREIRELFEKHGVLGRVIMPPSGITAIVEFVESVEARKAFTKLAYSKFKNMPLYLEWAPEKVLSEKKPPPAKSEYAEPNDSGTFKPDTNSNEPLVQASSEDEEEPEPETTLFIKNLNFKSTDMDLKKHFENCGKIHYATVATKKDKNNPNITLSMGYGFVRFKTRACTDKALKSMQQSVLDGKSLELKRSERTLQEDVQKSKKSSKATKQTGNKILVRNVPFQANKQEINELFSVFGEIKALRLPKKISGDSHRGFAFVDYVASSDAKKAFEALSQSTHLYGRRLVLEWASKEEEVEEIRKRTADHFQPHQEIKSKKSVFNID